MMDKFLREVGSEIPEEQPKQGPRQKNQRNLGVICVHEVILPGVLKMNEKCLS